MHRTYSLIAVILALTITVQSFASHFSRGKVVASPNNFTPATISNVHADGGTASSSFVKFTRGDTTGQLDYDGADIGIATGNNVFVNQWENASINFITAGNHRAVIASSGLVGIGLTDPTQALQIDKGTGVAGYTQYTAGATTGQASTDGMLVGINSSGGGVINVQESQPISISTAGTEAINVTATQTVVIKNKVEFEDPDSGTNRIAVMASESIASDYTLRLPATIGAVGSFLKLTGIIGATADLTFASAGGSVDTNWTSYTPSSSGFGTISDTTGRYRRVGDSIDLQIGFAAGTVAVSMATVSMPSGLNLDTAKANNSGHFRAIGSWYCQRTGANTVKAGTVHISTSDTNNLRFGSTDYAGTSNSLSALNGNVVCDNSTYVWIAVGGIPISGYGL